MWILVNKNELIVNLSHCCFGNTKNCYVSSHTMVADCYLKLCIYVSFFNYVFGLLTINFNLLQFCKGLLVGLGTCRARPGFDRPESGLRIFLSLSLAYGISNTFFLAWPGPAKSLVWLCSMFMIMCYIKPSI
jgi:hypothetical protein